MRISQLLSIYPLEIEFNLAIYQFLSVFKFCSFYFRWLCSSLSQVDFLRLVGKFNFCNYSCAKLHLDITYRGFKTSWPVPEFRQLLDYMLPVTLVKITTFWPFHSHPLLRNLRPTLKHFETPDLTSVVFSSSVILHRHGVW